MQQIIAYLTVGNTGEKEAQLESALNRAVQAASVDKAYGILLTRHDHARFTVALSPLVPYGRTYELDLA
jgi:hypothetical protein